MPGMVWDFKKADGKSFNAKLLELDWAFVDTSPIEQAAEHMVEIVLSMAICFLPIAFVLASKCLCQLYYI